MRRKKSLLIPAVLAFSLCTGAVVPVLAEETSQTADASCSLSVFVIAAASAVCEEQVRSV